MRKLKTKGVISDYDPETGRFEGYIDTDDRGYFHALVTYVGEAQWAFQFGKFFARRTTGEDSQNHHYWGHLQQLSEAEREDIKSLDQACRQAAISDIGWPFDIIGGVMVPYEETRDEIDTKIYGRLVDFVHDWASLLYGFVFYEGDRDDR